MDKKRTPTAEARAAQMAEATAEARTRRSMGLAMTPNHMLTRTEQAHATVARDNFPHLAPNANANPKAK